MRTYFNFKNLILSKSPNQYLVLPDITDSLSSPHEISPVFNISSKNLHSIFYEIIIKQRATKVLCNDKINLKSEFIQYTRFFRFPDYISIQIIDSGENISSLAIYSRSKFGYYDFGVNKRRVKLWISLLVSNISKTIE